MTVRRGHCIGTQEVTNCAVHSVSIEFAPSFRPRPIRHVLMDWDGTTTLSRAGWSEIMADIFIENLPHLPGDTDESLRAFSLDQLMRLAGRPSIHQMSHLADLVAMRGGSPEDPGRYQAEFQRRLGALAGARLAQVRDRARDADPLLVSGVRDMLEHLCQLGITVSLASGTPVAELREEIGLLGMAEYFEDRIHGPTDVHDRTFAKRTIIDDLLGKYSLAGASLLSFGDGPGELHDTKAVGGLAVAVASDEQNNGSGRVNPLKREVLLAAGADAVIADFRNPAGLMTALTT